MIKSSQRTGPPNIEDFKGRLDVYLKKNSLDQINPDRNLEKILEKSIKFLKSDTANETDATVVAHLLMGRAEKLPANVIAATDSIPPELKSTLNDLLRTNRYGINPETSTKTIAKLEHLLEIIKTNNSGKPSAAQDQNLSTERKDVNNQNIHVKSTKSSTAQEPEFPQFNSNEIQGWLFDGKQDTRLPILTPQKRLKGNYAPRKDLATITMLGEGKISSKVGSYAGNITDLKADSKQRARVGVILVDNFCMRQNNTESVQVLHAAGPELQRGVLNTHGIDAHQYSQSIITCHSREMRESHNIDWVQIMVASSQRKNDWYKIFLQALANAQDDDFIILPVPRATREDGVVASTGDQCAKDIVRAIKDFYMYYQDPKLKIILNVSELDLFDCFRVQEIYTQLIRESEK